MAFTDDVASEDAMPCPY